MKTIKVRYFRKKSSIVDVRPGSKYIPENGEKAYTLNDNNKKVEITKNWKEFPESKCPESRQCVESPSNQTIRPEPSFSGLTFLKQQLAEKNCQK